MATKRYEFQPPTNIVAIRSSIIQRLKKRTSVNAPPTPPPQANEFEDKLPFLHLDNGLPSPPIETCCFEEEVMPSPSTVMVVNALMDMSPTVEDSSSVIRERIRLLKEEKHKLFQVMKDLLSTPTKEDVEPSPVTTRPVIRSRSISHSESRPISRYYDRPRFYNNNGGYYPYQPNTTVSKRKEKKKPPPLN